MHPYRAELAPDQPAQEQLINKQPAELRTCYPLTLVSEPFCYLSNATAAGH